MFADKTLMQTCFASVTHAFLLLLGEYKSTTAVLVITKPWTEDSVGKDLGFCPCLKTSAAFLPQQVKPVGSAAVRFYSRYWYLLRRAAASKTSSLCSQPSITWQKEKCSCFKSHVPTGLATNDGNEERNLITNCLPMQMPGLSLCHWFLNAQMEISQCTFSELCVLFEHLCCISQHWWRVGCKKFIICNVFRTLISYMPHLQNQWKERDTSMWLFKLCVFERILNKNELSIALEMSFPLCPLQGESTLTLDGLGWVRWILPSF